MSKNKNLLKFTAIVFIAMLSLGFSPSIKADRFASIFDTMSRVAANVAASHTIYFSTTNGVAAAGTIVVTIPSAFTFGSSYDFTDMSLAQGSSSNCSTATFTGKTLAASASGTTWGAVKSGSTTITFTSATDTIAGNLCIRVILNTNGVNHTITNPNVTSNTVYNINVATALDVGDTSVIVLGDPSASNVDQVSINANVASSILMGIDTVVSGCNNNTQTTPANQIVNFGILYPGILQSSSATIPYICIEAGTNSTHGMRVLVQSSRASTVGGLVSGVGVIPSATANLNSANSGYGLRVSSTGTPTLGSFTISSPFNSVTSGDVGLISGSTGTAAQVVTSTGAVRSGSSSRIAIELSAKSDTTIPASTGYTDTLTFTAFTNL